MVPGTLTQRRDYLRVQHSRTSVRGRLLLLARAPRAPGDAGPVARAGFTVSRKVGNAVARNRVKRRLRVLWRQHGGGLTPADLVFVAFAEAAQVPFLALAEEFAWLCQQIEKRPLLAAPRAPHFSPERSAARSRP